MSAASTPDPSARAVAAAAAIMTDFARDTGVPPAPSEAPGAPPPVRPGSPPHPRRYLWTDAHAVCNALALHAHTNERRWLDFALRLVDQVHHVLGRHRDDDPREGWISGLSEEEGARHPTAGGLRIGKPLGERGPAESADPAREWEQDGQYFHYLTRWMHALGRVAAVTGEPRYHAWAVELARTAHRAFTVAAGPDGDRRMVWKMSIDLSRPLVDAAGQHDPLDGLVTFSTLAWTAPARTEADADSPAQPQPGGRPSAGSGSGAEAGPSGPLVREIRELAELCAAARWPTDDPLGLGGLLVDAYRVAVLERAGAAPPPGLLERILADAATSFAVLAPAGLHAADFSRRLPFRELGLAIGLAALERLRILVFRDLGRFGGSRPVGLQTEELVRHLPLRRRIEADWLDPRAQRAATWVDHLDINRVMLATSLLPEGYLGTIGEGG